MPAFIDIKGQKFNRLLAMEYASLCRWRCVCDCGNETITSLDHLRSGKTKSCGCKKREDTIARNTRHGLRHTPEYNAWLAIAGRCTNPKGEKFKYYGGRGIKLFEGWCGPGGFEVFFAHIGPRPSAKHSIDRIDSDGDYAPGNVRWATQLEQVRNQRSNRVLFVGGARRLGMDIARENGISEKVFRSRLGHGWTVERAATAPITRTRIAHASG